MPSGKSTGARINPAKKRLFYEHLRTGATIKEAAFHVGISYPTALALAKVARTTGGGDISKIRSQVFNDDDLPDPKHLATVSPEATRALADFGYFRARYFGRRTVPWQEQAAEVVVGLLTTPNKEYAVINCPPGSGKSTLFTHDIPVWLACRNRNIRILLGSRTHSQAKGYTGRCRRTFMRRVPITADPEDIERGVAFDAQATLIDDYGRFRPLLQDLWRIDEFVLALPDDLLVEDKESSFAAYGMDSGFLGGRFNYTCWDDLVDRRTLRTVEARETLITKYEDEMETRLEPGGVHILQGQRMSADDLYRHALDMKAGVLEDDTEVDNRPKKYHHIVFKAHYEDRCVGQHKQSDPAYPDGCLLDPIRLPWRELTTIQANRNEKYRVLYQQEDVDPANVLVPHVWITGGTDPSTGIDHPGCWDKDRRLADPPRGLTQPVYSVATADPSPSKYWAIQWWLYHPASQQRFLLDLLRQSMDAPDFLDWNYNQACFTGVMDEWQQRSDALGVPIRYWIVEANAAQRFMLQYDHVRRWLNLHDVSLVPHQTHVNKLDDNYGVRTIKTHYQFGRVRLPGSHSDGARMASMKLVDEVTRWPEGRTDDCVMAHWFLEWNIPRLFPGEYLPPKSWRPTWLRRSA